MPIWVSDLLLLNLSGAISIVPVLLSRSFFRQSGLLFSHLFIFWLFISCPPCQNNNSDRISSFSRLYNLRLAADAGIYYRCIEFSLPFRSRWKLNRMCHDWTGVSSLKQATIKKTFFTEFWRVFENVSKVCLTAWRRLTSTMFVNMLSQTASISW